MPKNTETMDHKVKNAILASLRSFSDTQDAVNAEQFVEVFSSTSGFLEKLGALDGLFDDNPSLEQLREVFFDLLLINFFASDAQRLESDYLESPKWLDIEEQTLDRGTELLNLLLYLRECADEDVEPTLEDYLKEFLLVDEDEFQDEHRIYEYLIANQILADSSYGDIARSTMQIDDEHELSEIFYPMVSFFLESNPTKEHLDEYERHSANPSLDRALYALIVNYHR